MFLLLMPIFAAPGEAIAAFSTRLHCIRLINCLIVFIAAGMPMYYLTARSRTASAREGDVSDEGGIKAVLRGGLLSHASSAR